MKKFIASSLLIIPLVMPTSMATYFQETRSSSSESALRYQESSPAATRPPQSPRRSMREIVMMPVVYKVPGMDQVKVQADLKYTDVDDPNLRMDAYIPPGLGKAARRPAVLFIHGGTGAANTPKDWGIYTSWGRLVAASGMVGVTFTHRLGFPKPLLTEAASDVTNAINYIRANADSLNIDKDKICLVAYSAGGPLLSLALRDRPEYIRCLVAFYAFLDVQQSELHKQHETAELVRNFSPITYLSGNANKLPPLFIARAGRDEIPTMNDSIDRFIREAVARNAPVTVVNHPEGVHGFDNQNDDARSREIVRTAVTFMKDHLGATEAKP